MNEQERFGYDNPHAPTINSDVGRGQRARHAEERIAEFSRTPIEQTPGGYPQTSETSTSTPSTLGGTARTFAWGGAIVGGLYGYFGFHQNIVTAGLLAGVGAIAGAVAGAIFYLALELLAVALKIGLVLAALYVLALMFGIVR